MGFAKCRNLYAAVLLGCSSCHQRRHDSVGFGALPISGRRRPEHSVCRAVCDSTVSRSSFNTDRRRGRPTTSETRGLGRWYCAGHQLEAVVQVVFIVLSCERVGRARGSILRPRDPVVQSRVPLAIPAQRSGSLGFLAMLPSAPRTLDKGLTLRFDLIRHPRAGLRPQSGQ